MTIMIDGQLWKINQNKSKGGNWLICVKYFIFTSQSFNPAV